MIQFPAAFSVRSANQTDGSIQRSKQSNAAPNTVSQPQASSVELELVRAEDYLSAEEREFIGQIKSQYGLSEDDMNAFYVVGLMRHGNLHADVSSPDFFSTEWFGEQMRIDATTNGRSWNNRPYLAAIDYLQAHTAPRPPERLPYQSRLNVYA